MKNALWTLLVISSQVMGSTIAVIDSGVDVQHKDLVNNIWMNEKEIVDNGRDDDKNGYEDDIYGWNFAEQNNLVIDRKYLGTFSQDPYLFFEIQGKMFLQQASKAEIDWLRGKTSDPEFIKEMGKFGNFVHGTHVAGITVNNNPDGKVLSVKLIPTEIARVAKSIAEESESVDDTEAQAQPESIRLKLLKAGLKTLASQQMLLLEEIAAYVGNHKADIANGSFGTGFPQAQTITDSLFKLAMGRSPKPQESYEITKFFLDALVESGKQMVAAAPNTLFVFAAGNDGLSNDIYGSSPTNIVADNVISVGATYKYDFIAPFSNYGTKTVDVAAPGMLIHSTIPGNEYLKVSGTSQAAPYVANIAAQIKDINKNLSPKEIKQIIMGTVDEKGFLKNKIKSKGIVNMGRATFAAKLSLSTSVKNAISEAKVSIDDVKSSNVKFLNMSAKEIIPIPLVPMFK